MKGLPRWEPEKEEPNADVDWQETTSCYSDALDPNKTEPQPDDTPIPRSFVIRVKSSSNDSEWLIHNPADFLLQTLVANFPDLGLDKDMRVTTFIVNHQNTLSGRHLYVTANVPPGENTVGLTGVKIKPR